MTDLTLLSMIKDQDYTVKILGPHGVIETKGLTWMMDRQDLIEVIYWESWAVLQGIYHCCLSVPGKVSLLEPNDPSRTVS